MQKIKLIAVDLDGPLLVDTFSPVIRAACIQMGVAFTATVERNTVSRKRSEAAEYLRNLCREYFDANGMSTTDEELVAEFFRLRDDFMKNNANGMKEGVPAFLAMLAELDARCICYGGLAESHMRDGLGEHARVFERYVCTNDFRPGLKEIIADFRHDPAEVLFIDDTCFVADHALALGCPFIGVPTTEPWSFQKEAMIDRGVTHIVNSVSEIDRGLVERIDRADGSVSGKNA